MNQAQFRMLTATEQTLVVSTEAKRLDALDEDELLALHDRVRRARTKYTKLYRRDAAARVRTDAARGKASAKNANTAAKAEIFEDALARVSRKLAAVARESAAVLKAERLAAAKATPTPARRGSSAGASPNARRARATSSATAGRRGDASLRSPAGKRASAQQRAATRRGQAKRAAR
jgi:hypothetical protein